MSKNIEEIVNSVIPKPCLDWNKTSIAERVFCRDSLKQALTEGKLVVVEDCPNCPNQGWYSQQLNEEGDCEQVQCEFCHTYPRSRFRLFPVEEIKTVESHDDLPF